MVTGTVLRGLTVCPARFCAPMAGLTHSAFRRLVADFGGYGALFTEMLCGRWLLGERLEDSAAVKRRESEGLVIYQLMLREATEVPAVLDRLGALAPVGVDLNCACPAPSIRAAGAGAELFEDPARLEAILRALRRGWDGPLTVKIRLGRPEGDWRGRLLDRFRLLADGGVDAVTLHPRFSTEKLRRRARHAWFPELAAATSLPLIGSGDIHGPEVVEAHPEHFAGLAGIMVGRRAVVQPWVFAAWDGAVPEVDHLEVWRRLVRYTLEDFPVGKAFYRVKAFTRYFARNFRFGHTLDSLAQAAPDLGTLVAKAERFLEGRPALLRWPDLAGLA